MADTWNQFTCIVFLEMFLYTNVNKVIEKQESEFLTNIGEMCMQTMPSYLYFWKFCEKKMNLIRWFIFKNDIYYGF